METRNCPRCGKLFTYFNRRLCDSCTYEEEQIFKKIKEYVDENPTNTIQEVADATGASPKKILSYLKEGRLTAIQGFRGELKCERCGVTIVAGKLCDKCVISINNTVNEMFSEGKKVPKMHTSNAKKN